MLRSTAHAGRTRLRLSARHTARPPRAALAALILIATLLYPAYVSPTHSAGMPPATVRLSGKPMGSRYVITASGTYTESPSELDVYVHSGTQECPASQKAENTRVEDQIQHLGTNAAFVLINYLLDRHPGSFTQQAFLGGDVRDGTYWVCAYLLISRIPGHDPADPPQATAFGRLTVGRSGLALTGSALAVQIDRFYTISKAATDILLAHPQGPPPPQTGTFPSSTKKIYLYFSYRGARPHVTQYEIHVHIPLGGNAWEFDSNPHPLNLHNGSQVYTSYTDNYPTLSGSKAPLPGVYSADLLVDGQIVARTSFRVEG